MTKQLTLCVLTWNNELQLPAFLDHYKTIVDEVIVGDLGSQDATVAAGKKFGATVVAAVWNSSYSEVLNQCLDKARGRWILVLQINEIVAPQHLASIQPLLANPNVEGYLLDFDEKNKARITPPAKYLRLFRNRREYRYKYRGFPSLPQIQTIKNSGIGLLLGPTPPEREDWYGLLEEEIKQEPQDGYLNYLYGINLLNQQEFRESIPYLRRAKEVLGINYVFAPHIYKSLIWALMAIKDWSGAEAFIIEGIRAFPFYTDFFVLRGEMRAKARNFQGAVADLKSALNNWERSGQYVPRPDMGKSVIYEKLGEVHEQALNFNQALDSFVHAYELRRDYKLIYNIGRVERTDSRVIEDLAAKSADNPYHLLAVLDVFFQQGRYQLALDYIQPLESVMGEQVKLVKSMCYTMLGKFKKAEEVAMVNPGSKIYSQFIFQKVEGLWYQGKWIQADQVLDEVIGLGDSPKATAYQDIGGILQGKSKILPPDLDYELVDTVHENLVWFGQPDKALILLPWLLKHRQARPLELARPWVRADNIKALALIHSSIPDDNKPEFRQRVILDLVQEGHLDTAETIRKLGNRTDLGPVDCYLSKVSLEQKLDQWLGDVKTTVITEKPHLDLVDMAFSCGLEPASLSCWELYIQLGEYFLQGQSNPEALMSYLRSLMWNPLSLKAAEKVNNLNQESDLAHILLAQWKLEGDIFTKRADFTQFLKGLLAFTNLELNTALGHFNNLEKTNYVAKAYIASCLWLQRGETEIKDEIKPWVKVICQNYIQLKTQRAKEIYPYSELLK